MFDLYSSVHISEQGFCSGCPVWESKHRIQSLAQKALQVASLAPNPPTRKKLSMTHHPLPTPHSIALNFRSFPAPAVVRIGPEDARAQHGHLHRESEPQTERSKERERERAPLGERSDGGGSSTS